MARPISAPAPEAQGLIKTFGEGPMAVRALRGSMEIHGRRYDNLADRELTEPRGETFGVVQFFNLMPTLTAAENVLLPALVAGEPPSNYADRTDELLAMVGGRRADRQPRFHEWCDHPRPAAAAGGPGPHRGDGDHDAGAAARRTGRGRHLGGADARDELPRDVDALPVRACSSPSLCWACWWESWPPSCQPVALHGSTRWPPCGTSR